MADLNPGPAAEANPANFTKRGDYLYFSAKGTDSTSTYVGNELWRLSIVTAADRDWKYVE